MNIALDLGSTTTKIVAMEESLCIAQEQYPSVHGKEYAETLLRSFFEKYHLQENSIQKIAVTGVGSSFLGSCLLGKEVVPVSEFIADCAGALSFSGLKEAIVVSVGTGTAFLYASEGRFQKHLIGSGIGGGTMQGLGSLLAKTSNIQELSDLSSKGSPAKVDLTVGDMTDDVPPTLEPDMTGANFGLIKEDAQTEDQMAGLTNLVVQAIGTMSILCSSLCGTKDIILIGGMTRLPQVQALFHRFDPLYQVHLHFLEDGTFATAIGAGLSIQ